MEENEKKISLKYYMPVLFIIVIIPLITYGKIIELPLEEANFWKGGTFHVDFFSYYKSTFLIITSCAALLSFAVLFLKHKLPVHNYREYYVPMILYSAFVIISTMLSPYRNVALLGFMDMFQGMSVLLCYILLTFIMMNIINSEKALKKIIYAFVLITAVVGFLGLSQYFGYDFFQTDFGKNLITPESLENSDFKFSFGKYTIYATMYNTNFVGSFSALVMPVCTFLFLHEHEKKKELMFFTAFILSYTTWLGCNSRAGYFGIMVAVFICVVLFIKLLREKFKKIIFLAIICTIITLVFNMASNGRVLKQFSRLSPLNEADKIKKIQQNTIVRFEEISVRNSKFTIRTSTEELIITAEDYELQFMDGNGKILKTQIDKNNVITFENKKYSGYIFSKAENSPFIRLSAYERPLRLYITEEDDIKVVSMNYKLTEPVLAPHISIFDGMETLASNRGYIWSRSIPMMKSTILIGYGPDNFCLMFPQEDYVGRFNTGKGMTNIVVDKPHNMYIQTAINTGVISMLSLMFMWGIYFVDSVRLFKGRGLMSFSEYVGAGSFLGITAYLAAGLFNDSIVSVAPLFWIMLGLGIAVNKMIEIDNFANRC